MHKWRRNDDLGTWEIDCTKREKWFSPQCEDFKINGLCPYCKKDAKTELEKRKREKEEKERQKQMSEEKLNKNTLGGWF